MLHVAAIVVRQTLNACTRNLKQLLYIDFQEDYLSNLRANFDYYFRYFYFIFRKTNLRTYIVPHSKGLETNFVAL